MTTTEMAEVTNVVDVSFCSARHPFKAGNPCRRIVGHDGDHSAYVNSISTPETWPADDCYVDDDVRVLNPVIAPLLKQSEYHPEGRHIYYEGDDPQQFVEEIKAEFGFDPSADEDWAFLVPADDRAPAFYSYGFHCPAEHLDEVYGSDRWPMGS